MQYIDIWNTDYFNCTLNNYSVVVTSFMLSWTLFVITIETIGLTTRELCRTNEKHICRPIRTLAIFNFYAFFDNTFTSCIFVTTMGILYACMQQLSFMIFNIVHETNTSYYTNFRNLVLISIYCVLILKAILFFYVVFCYILSDMVNIRRDLQFFNGPTQSMTTERVADDDIFSHSNGFADVPLEQHEFVDVSRVDEYHNHGDKYSDSKNKLPFPQQYSDTEVGVLPSRTIPPIPLRPPPPQSQLGESEIPELPASVSKSDDENHSEYEEDLDEKPQFRQHISEDESEHQSKIAVRSISPPLYESKTQHTI